MPCPRCSSSNLWDDNLWWGCDDCGFACGEDGPTFLFAKDLPGLARSVQEMRERGQLPAAAAPADRTMASAPMAPDLPA